MLRKRGLEKKIKVAEEKVIHITRLPPQRFRIANRLVRLIVIAKSLHKISTTGPSPYNRCELRKEP